MKINGFKKSVLAMMLFVVLLCSFCVNVSAYEGSDTTITPRWVSIYSINLNMAFDEDSGVVTAVATKKSGASLIEGTLYLYKLVNGKIEAIEFIASKDKKLINITLNELKIKSGILIAAIIREGEIITPSGQTMIQEGDSVIVISKDHILYELRDILE